MFTIPSIFVIDNSTLSTHTAYQQNDHKLHRTSLFTLSLYGTLVPLHLLPRMLHTPPIPSALHRDISRYTVWLTLIDRPPPPYSSTLPPPLLTSLSSICLPLPATGRTTFLYTVCLKSSTAIFHLRQAETTVHYIILLTIVLCLLINLQGLSTVHTLFFSHNLLHQMLSYTKFNKTPTQSYRHYLILKPKLSPQLE